MKYWLFENNNIAKIDINEDNILLSNGLVSRCINIHKGTISLKNLVNDLEYLGKISNDYEIVVDGVALDIYSIHKDCIRVEQHSPIVAFDYNPKPFITENTPYPPKSKAVSIYYDLKDFIVEVEYTIYDNLPTISKRIILTNNTKKDIIINKYVVDRLSISEKNYNLFYGETNYNGGCMNNNNRTLSVQYDGSVVSFTFDIGPNANVKSGERFYGLTAYELLHFVEFYEQKMIEVKQMYRLIFPWVLESPFIFHLMSDRPKKIKKAIELVERVGFDGIIQTFGSNVNIESRNNRYIEKHRKLYDYAHSKGISIGGYTLAIVKNYLRVRGKERNDYAGGGGIFRCLASEWSKEYWKNIYNFYDRTNADLIEIDGPYHFYKCSGGEGHLHKDINDSRYLQWKLSTVDMLAELKRKNVYVNAPDWLYMNGVNKSGIGYEEIAFSEPREEQLIASRIYNYKGTFNKIPSMGWGFLPMSVYHGGGSLACFAPVSKHKKEFTWAIFQAVMSGVIPCIRGKSLVDSKEGEEILSKWVSFYKKYKNVINGNTIHFMPPRFSKDNKCRTSDLDAVLNVCSSGEVRGILAVFNQTDRDITKSISVPIFYTNLCNVEVIPPPYKNCLVSMVENPVYGQYPPPFPVDSEEKLFVPDKVTGMSGNYILVEEQVDMPPSIQNIGSVTIVDEQGIESRVSYDSNANINIDISLKSMSYTYFIIKA